MIENIPLKKASGGPMEDIVGLAVPGSVPVEELEILERAYRDAPSGAGQVMFTTDELDADGEPTGREIWDEVTEKRPTEAARWRRIMGWPENTRDPTPADANAFLQSVNAEASALAWYAVQAFRDKAATPPVRPASPAATDALDDPEPAPRPRPRDGGYKVA
jgi:hypothetical protein